MNRQLMLWTTLAALIASVSWSQAATLTVTTDLLIQLDGTNTTLVSGEVNSWNNQVSPVGVTTVFTATAPGNRPNLLTAQPMPNGSAHNLVDFRKSGSGTSAPSFTASDFLTGAASPAFNSLRTITMFTVYNVDLLLPGGNTVGQKEQVPFVSRHVTTSPNTTTAWSHTFEDDHDGVTLGDQPAVMPQFRQGSSLNTLFTDADFSSPIVANSWYIVATRWNGTGVDVNGLPAFTTNSVVVTPGATPGDLEVLPKSFSDSGPFEWSTHDGFVIGKNATTGSTGGALRGFLDGQIAEILVYGDTLSGADFRSVSSYLRQKYFVPEPSSVCLMALGVAFGAVYLRRVK